MKLEEWCRLKNVGKSQAKKWIENGWIPGAYRQVDGEYSVPSQARVPYTGARAKKEDSIRVSVCRACMRQLGVCGSLYGCASDVFQGILQGLVEEGFLVPVVYGGITYYDATTAGEDYVLKHRRDPQAGGAQKTAEVLNTALQTLKTAAEIAVIAGS